MNSKIGRIALLLICISSLAVASLQAQTPAPALNAPTDAIYVIEPNDLLTIYVYSHPELSGDVTVQQDGRISTPLAQSIKASGLTSDQLKESLEKKLNDVIEVANVTVMVKAIQSYRVFVIGKVQKQGLIAYEKPINVLQALSMAGGLVEYAKKDKIMISRTVPGKAAKLIPFNYDEITVPGKEAQNIFLETGDIVIVP